MILTSGRAVTLVAAVCACMASARAQTARSNQPATVVYVAHLHPVNNGVTKLESTGEARFTIRDDNLTITVDAAHVPPDMNHLQHFHGFTNGSDATCPTVAADKNRDGIVDLMETEPISGITMVPFTEDPVSMQIVTDTYPKASADGAYHYTKTVSLKALEAAFAKTYNGQHLNLARRVVFIHGVPAGTQLPTSVASLDHIPAQVTLPIACGKVERSAQ